MDASVSVLDSISVCNSEISETYHLSCVSYKVLEPKQRYFSLASVRKSQNVRLANE